MASSPINSATMVLAIYSFKGKNNDELCFKKGDIIIVTQKEEGGWWEGTLNGTTGWFPSNYVKEHKPKGAVLEGNKVSGKLAVDLSTQQKNYRNLVLKDLIDSEKANVAELKTLISNFLHPLEKSNILNKDEYRQLVGNIDSVVEIHSKLLIALETCSELPSLEQRVGKLFLASAPQIKQIHLSYCSSHPRSICILNKHKDALNSFMESRGAASPGLLVLTTGLSKPFRRLEKYSGIFQELERHIEENHPDRGDTQRSVSVYKDIWSACSAKRRQKEQELEILTSGVRGWEGEELSTLGEIIHMGSVAVGPFHRDRYLVLFPTTLLILSVSSRMSGFIYEGKLPLTGINIKQPLDTDTYKNAFEISGPLIEKIVAVCQTREDQQVWVDILRQTISTLRKCSIASSQSNPPIQVSPNITCPYSGLTEYFATLVKTGVITRALLKRLLYRQFADESVSVFGVKIRENHKMECVIFPTQLSFEQCKSSTTWSDSEILECDNPSHSSVKHSNSFKNQNFFDFSRRNCSSYCRSASFKYIRYFPVDSKFFKVVVAKNHGVNEATNGKSCSSKSEGSNSEIFSTPVTHRACENLSALEIIETVAYYDKLKRKSLPSLLCPISKASINLSYNERRASLDLINLLKFPLKGVQGKTNSNVDECDTPTINGDHKSSLFFKSSYSYFLNDESTESEEKNILDTTIQNCKCQNNQSVEGLYTSCKHCCADILGSPRSSDSGLADITGTSTTLTPSGIQECTQWNSRTESLYDTLTSVTMIQFPINTDKVENRSIYSSLSLSSKNEHVESHLNSNFPACTGFKPTLSSSFSWNENNTEIYRSGMYAHWWLKTYIPTDAFEEESSKKSRKGKISVSLTDCNFDFGLALMSILSSGISKVEPINKKFHDPWSVISLKPLPPLRPTFTLGKNIRNKQSLSPILSGDNNYEEDIQILRVIEAYCSSNRVRVGSSVENSSNESQSIEKSFSNKMFSVRNHEILIQERCVMDNVNYLRFQFSELSQKLNIISRKLDKEIETRTIFQNSIKSKFFKMGYEVD